MDGKWPNFFIVGAARAGTTSLYYYLRGHPDIFMPAKVKETHFFAEVDPDIERFKFAGMKVIKEEADYLKLFEEAKNKIAVGEACPSYLYDERAPLHIKEKVPKAKIIMILREPIDRAYSHYLMDVREGVQQKPFYDALLEDYANPKKVWGAAHLYVELGLYYEQVKRYLDTFGSEQVRIYLYDEFKSNTIEVVKDVCDFLGVSFYEGRFFDPGKKYNVYAQPRNILFQRIMGNPYIRSLAISLVPRRLLIPLRSRVLLAGGSKPPMDQRAVEFLRSIYYDDILKLQDLIRRDLSGWIYGG
jgi:hypothetical protein